MLLLIPVSRFRVDYQLAFGRPYSEFERLTLKAIAGGVCKVSELESLFRVHPRLILESLVTLTQAGWLAVGGSESSEFVLTASGRAAAASGQQPRSRQIEPGFTWLVMERITGALINSNEVRYLSTRDIIQFEDQALKISERVLQRSLNEAQVDPHISRAKGEWLHRITSMDMRTRQAHWIPVTLDLDTGEFDDNLPAKWEPRVGPIVMEIASKSHQAKDNRLRGMSGPSLPIRKTRGEVSDAIAPPSKFPVLLNPGDLIFDDEAHRNYLNTVFKEANSKVLIASAFLRISCLEILRSAIFSALSRGVSIDLLWGYGAPGVAGSEGLEYLKRMAYDARKNDFAGRVRFNKFPSGSHAKLIIWDRDRSIEACLGSYNWLSAMPPDASALARLSNASVCVRHPGLVSRLMRCAMTWWSGSQTASLDAAPAQWRRLASQIDERNLDYMQEDTNASAELIMDLDHEYILRRYLTEARERLVVASHKLGRIAEARLAAASGRTRAEGFHFHVLYGTSEVDADMLRDITLASGEAGAVFKNVPSMHAKILLSESGTCIGSYNFLSADPFGTAKNARELSIMIEGEAATQAVWDNLRQREEALR